MAGIIPTNNPAALVRIILVGGLVLMLGLAIFTRADILIFIGILVALVVVWKAPQEKAGNLSRAKADRKAVVASNIQPKLGNLWRASPHIAGKTLIGKINTCNVITQTNDAGGKDIIYEASIIEGRWPKKKMRMYLFRKSDLVLPKSWKDRPLEGDLTLKCSGFVSCMTHDVPDSWTLDEQNEIGMPIVRTLVGVDVAADVLEERTEDIRRAKNSDERHLKEMDKIKEGAGDPTR